MSHQPHACHAYAGLNDASTVKSKVPSCTSDNIDIDKCCGEVRQGHSVAAARNSSSSAGGGIECNLESWKRSSCSSRPADTLTQPVTMIQPTLANTPADEMPRFQGPELYTMREAVCSTKQLRCALLSRKQQCSPLLLFCMCDIRMGYLLIVLQCCLLSPQVKGVLGQGSGPSDCEYTSC